jgi:glycosyltransferase involved in cell wall biosynthesis
VVLDVDMDRLLMNVGPWLEVPPPGYGGIENVVATLVPELRARGVHVVLAAAGSSTLAADAHVSAFAQPQFDRIGAPYNATVGVAHAHMQAVVDAIDAHEIDLVHDHLEVVGPSVLAALGTPTLQTLHWDTGRHPEFYAGFDGRGSVFFAGVSERQIQIAPPALRAQTLGAVPLAVDPAAFPFSAVKDGPSVVLARISPLKGQHVAVRLGVDVIIAGPVEDEAYWTEDVEPHVDGRRVRWVGTLTGRRKLETLARARAALFPVQWEEPGGTAVVEALACGTPVVAMRRGCMPSLVEHGVTGWLADTDAEFAEGVRRAGDIDPAACRAAAEDRFSAGAMADRYLELYDEVVRRTSVTAPRTRPAAPRARERRPPA